MLSDPQTGCVVVGRKNVLTLAYTDDLVVLAKNEKDMKGIIKN